MRNATCVGTQTSKVPTRVTLLFIPYTVCESPATTNISQENGHAIFMIILIIHYHKMAEIIQTTICRPNPTKNI